MEAPDALRKFVVSVLVPAKAQRIQSLIQTRRGQMKALDSLSHDLKSAVRADLPTPERSSFWQLPCFLFRAPKTFGARWPSFEAAYEGLSTEDSWLLISEDGRFGVYRPEGRWDGERAFAA